MSISKELLSEVLEEDIVEVGSFNSPILEINVQRYSYKEWRKINIYELAHKCKEKAYDLGFDIYSDFNGADVCRIGSNYSIAPLHHNVTEVEAIIKSYEWILENKGTR